MENKKELILAGVALLVLLIVVAPGIYRYLTIEPYAEIDAQTLCRTDGKIPKHSIILIDTTDKLPPSHTKEVHKFIERARDNIALHEKITILHLKQTQEGDPENKYILQEKLSLCSPGHPDEMENIDVPRAKTRNTYNGYFQKPLRTIMEELPELPEAKDTPLFDALTQISRRHDFSHNVDERHLIIFSDFLQNTTAVNQYRKLESVEDLKKRGIEIADFSNIHIGIIYINRPAKENSTAFKRQTKSHQNFWESYFVESGAASANWLLNTAYHRGEAAKAQEKAIKRAYQNFKITPPLDRIYVTSPYGLRIDPIDGGIEHELHAAVDFRASIGTPIYAAAAGKVKKIHTIDDPNSYGLYVVLEHAHGFETLYAHIDEFEADLRKGKRIKQGDIIGYSGNTGRSSAPHLHFEVHHKGKPINPCHLNLEC